MTRWTGTSAGRLALPLEILLAFAVWAPPAWAQAIPTGLFATEIEPPPGHESLVGYAVNDGGQVVGASVGTGDSGPSAGPFENILDSGAFLWLPEPAYGLPAGTQGLPRVDADSIQSGEGINDQGQVIGWAARINGEQLTGRRLR